MIRSPLAQSSPPPAHGFSLVEVTLSIGMVSVGLLAIIGLLGNALQTGRETSEENRAVAISRSVIDDLRNDAKNGKMADTAGTILAPNSVGIPAPDFGLPVSPDPNAFAIRYYCSFDENGNHIASVAGNPNGAGILGTGQSAAFIVDVLFSTFPLSSGSGVLPQSHATRAHLRVFPFAPFIAYQDLVGKTNTANPPNPPKHYRFEAFLVD